MKKLLWFSKTGDQTSFSRISSSIIPRLKEHYDIHLLGPVFNDLVPNEKFTKTGDPILELGITYEEFEKGAVGSNLHKSMNYVVLQAMNLLTTIKFDYFIICNGVHEVNFFVECIRKYTRNIKTKINTKLISWVPIDEVPSIKLISGIFDSDLIITMTPVMVDYINKIGARYQKYTQVECVGHGSDILNIFDKNAVVDGKNRTKLFKELRNSGIYIRNIDHVDYNNDILILNANNCKFNNRKRLDLTIQGFVKFQTLYNRPNVKLWLHTDLKTLHSEYYKKIPYKITNLILESQIGISDKQLSIIYSLCQIGLQTSTGEGFSMTNIEHSMHNGLQIVPDFLATGYHYNPPDEEPRGLLLKVQPKLDPEYNTITGLVDVDDIATKIKEAVYMIKTNDNKLVENAYNYVKQFSWDSIAKQLESKINLA